MKTDEQNEIEELLDPLSSGKERKGEVPEEGRMIPRRSEEALKAIQKEAPHTELEL